MKIRIAGFLDNSMVNGEGLRAVVFVSGCNHNCKGCHNAEMQNFCYGEEMDIDDILKRIKKNPIIRGVTFSGGEPFEQAKALSELARLLKEAGLNIWCYTGYTYEQLLERKETNQLQLLSHIDVLVDGPFMEEHKDGAAQYTGSSNQRVIKLK